MMFGAIAFSSTMFGAIAFSVRRSDQQRFQYNVWGNSVSIAVFGSGVSSTMVWTMAGRTGRKGRVWAERMQTGIQAFCIVWSDQRCSTHSTGRVVAYIACRSVSVDVERVLG